MLELARLIRDAADGPMLIHSNAGIPAIRQGQIVYPETPEFMAPRFKELSEMGVNIFGAAAALPPGTSAPSLRYWADEGSNAMTVASMPRLSAVEAVERYGKCLELVPIDPHFHHISIGLYSREGVATV